MDEKQEYFVISVAAELTGMHAQTLRTYDRLGLVTPMRTKLSLIHISEPTRPY